MIDEVKLREAIRKKSIEYLEKAKVGGDGFGNLVDVAVGVALGEVVNAIDKTHKKDTTTGFPQ